MNQCIYNISISPVQTVFILYLLNPATVHCKGYFAYAQGCQSLTLVVKVDCFSLLHKLY